MRSRGWFAQWALAFQVPHHAQFQALANLGSPPQGGGTILELQRRLLTSHAAGCLQDLALISDRCNITQSASTPSLTSRLTCT